MTSIHAKVLSTEKYGDQISPHYRTGAFRVSRRVRKTEVQEKSLLRLLWHFFDRKLGLRLITAKILGSRQAKRFRFGGPIRTWKLGCRRDSAKPHYYENQIRHRPG